MPVAVATLIAASLVSSLFFVFVVLAAAGLVVVPIALSARRRGLDAGNDQRPPGNGVDDGNTPPEA